MKRTKDIKLAGEQEGLKLNYQRKEDLREFFKAEFQALWPGDLSDRGARIKGGLMGVPPGQTLRAAGTLVK